MHNAIGYSYVVHLHPTAVNGVMCADAEQRTLELLGPMRYIPYIDPGYVLLRKWTGA